MINENNNPWKYVARRDVSNNPYFNPSEESKTISKPLIMQNDCRLLKESSLYVRDWIDKQSNVKEESLTDWLLFDISNKIKRISYRAFYRNEEAKITGADWEWWFLFRKNSYKFRVQAKKIKTIGDNYPSIAYSNKYGLQIDKLISDSIDNNSIPIYSFYTNKIDRTKCGHHILDEGVYLTGANGLNKKFIQVGRKIVQFNDILEDSIPLSCMLCCPMIHHNDVGGDFAAFISNYFNTEIKNNDSNQFTGQYKEIPAYVKSFIELSHERKSDFWEKEFEDYLKNVNGIVIFDNRNTKE
jgi:hypothetical protein